jgi:hypothetical protein
MELIALISLNIAFGLGFYIIISAKMARTLKENQGSQLEKKVRTIYSDFIQDSTQSFEILDKKILSMRELLVRTEKTLALLQEEIAEGTGVSIQLQNLLNQTRQSLKAGLESALASSRELEVGSSKSVGEESRPEESSSGSPSSSSSEALRNSAEANYIRNKAKAYSENLPKNAKSSQEMISIGREFGIQSEPSLFPKQREENREVSNLEKMDNPESSALVFLGKVGRKLSSMVGIEATESALTRKNVPTGGLFSTQKNPGTISEREVSGLQVSENRRLLLEVSGDPYEETDWEESVHNVQEEEKLREKSFEGVLAKSLQPKKPGDTVSLSIDSLVAELPPSATKIDRVVHLLKKGFSHQEISSALDIGTREVSLIETVRLDRNRRI